MVESLTFWPISKLASELNSGKRQETPASETRGFVTHSNSNRVSAFSAVPQVPVLTGVVKRVSCTCSVTPVHTVGYRRGA